MQSGNCAVQTRDEAERAAQALVERVGCNLSVNPRDCLRQKQASELIQGLPSPPWIAHYPRVPGLQGDWRPHVDGWLLPVEPYQQIQGGNHSRAALIVGIQREGNGSIC